MNRLIDAEELKEYLEDAYDAGCIDKYYNQRRRTIFDEALDCVDEQPTVDAVRVIRCKDCKYYSYGTVEGKHLCMSVKYRFTPTAEDEWCSRAERKEE